MISVFYNSLSQGFLVFLSSLPPPLSLCGCIFVCSLIFVEPCVVLSHRHSSSLSVRKSENSKVTSWDIMHQSEEAQMFVFLRQMTDDLCKKYSMFAYNWMSASWKWIWTKPGFATVWSSTWSSVFVFLPHMRKSWVHVPGKVALGLARSYLLSHRSQGYWFTLEVSLCGDWLAALALSWVAVYS